MPRDMALVRRSGTALGRAWFLGSAAAALLLAAPQAPAQPRGKPAQDAPGLLARMAEFRTQVPDHPVDFILTNPTRTSVGLSVLAYADVEGYVEFDGPDWPARARTAPRRLKAGEPAMFELDGLEEDTAYRYRFLSRTASAGADPGRDFAPSEPGTFRTPRPPGAPFRFTVIADSHLDANMLGPLYERTLANASSDGPDFHIDLGDTFMTDKRGRDFKNALPQYIAQRYYLGLLGRTAPVFMVLGNHDGEWGHLARDAESMAPWSFAARTRYFPPPMIAEQAGDGMYTGRTAFAQGRGSNYYTFAWGDARLIVLDPFWSTTEKARDAGARVRGAGAPAPDDLNPTDQSWTMTLGREQYDWLARTLECSRSRHTFVFIHHLVGGLGRATRGGVEAAPYFEWGGRNADGSDGFAVRRPGWPMPIHALLVKHRVSAVFHGHDHLYARQELDGVCYQCVPQPGNLPRGNRADGEYGYRAGTRAPGSGHLRVSVSPDAAQVEFIRASGTDPRAQRPPDPPADRVTADSYQLPARPDTP